jgi:hypothetical protein
VIVLDPHKVFYFLAAPGPNSGDTDTAMMYRPLIGSWDIAARWFTPGGGVKEARGEWHFTWILGGRGVQDVLFQAGSTPDQFGTTLRCYDPTMDIWHVTWMQPSGSEFVNLTGRKVGGRIVQEGNGQDTSRQERWSFTDINENTFTWLGEVSHDGGVTWVLEQEMFGTRMVEV